MQVTGIVEDAIAAKVKATEALARKNQETLSGLRFMEGGRAILVAGVWGVLGFRRRILVSLCVYDRSCSYYHLVIQAICYNGYS
jgi:hypothetical protein